MVKDCLLGSVSRTETTGGNKQSKFANKSQNYDLKNNQEELKLFSKWRQSLVFLSKKK